MPTFNSVEFNAALFGGASVPTGAVIQAGQGLLYPALRKAGITLGPQRTPSPAQFQDAIDELNRLIGSLNCDRLNIYSLDILELPLTPNQKAYTIGQDPTGEVIADWDVPRPQGITEANAIANNGSQPLRYPLAIVTSQVWARIRLQDLPNTIPQAIYNDRAYPISTIYIYGQSMPNMTLELFTWHQIPTFATLTDVVLLPPGYEDALVLNLAVRMAPHFQLPVNPDVRNDAQKALMRLESINAPQPIADTSALGCRDGYNRYNIYSDQWRR